MTRRIKRNLGKPRKIKALNLLGKKEKIIAKKARKTAKL